MDLLAKSDFVAELTDIRPGRVGFLQTCAADFADGGSTAPITITDPTCPAPPAVRRNVQKRDEIDLTASILADIAHYQSTAVAPALGPNKVSSRSLDLVALARRQASTCANTGQCFERCPDCRDQQTYCGTTATIITTAVCGALGVAANAIAGTVSAAACGTACAPLGPGRPSARVSVHGRRRRRCAGRGHDVCCCEGGHLQSADGAVSPIATTSTMASAIRTARSVVLVRRVP